MSIDYAAIETALEGFDTATATPEDMLKIFHTIMISLQIPHQAVTGQATNKTTDEVIEDHDWLEVGDVVVDFHPDARSGAPSLNQWFLTVPEQNFTYVGNVAPMPVFTSVELPAQIGTFF